MYAVVLTGACFCFKNINISKRAFTIKLRKHKQQGATVHSPCEYNSRLEKQKFMLSAWISFLDKESRFVLGTIY